MMSLALSILPPPSSSLLPSSTPDAAPHIHQPQSHPYSHRRKHSAHNNRGALALLSQDERTIHMRKTAIAMYGYSWLKPAGCGKTMLGRREEEVEREEVERQLREVELQERHAMEAEEAERIESLRRQGEEGGTAMEGGERDLDDDVPDAEQQDEEDDYIDDEEREADEEEMDGDLDDDVPNAESSWVYDTNRDPDTESDEADYDEANVGHAGTSQQVSTRQVNQNYLSSPPHQRQYSNRQGYLGMDDAAETEAMVNAMLEEDELGEMNHDRDLDDEVPDLDADMDVDMDDELEDRDLDDDVPEAGDEEEEWQHTDTELEESEMDISILALANIAGHPPSHERQPPHSIQSGQGRRSGIGPGTTHESIRRTSGNVMQPPSSISIASQPVSNQPFSRAHAVHQRQHEAPLPDLRRQAIGLGRRETPQTHYHTPVIGTADSISNFISTDGSSMIDTNPVVQIGGPTRLMNLGQSSAIPATASTTGDTADNTDPQRSRHSWLNPAGARRNLFGGLARQTSGPSSQLNTSTIPTSSISTTTSQTGSQQYQQQRQQTTTNTAISSGGLFTPDPRIANINNNNSNTTETGPPTMDTPFNDDEVPRSRTRSGRLLASIQVSRRTGRRRRGEIDET